MAPCNRDRLERRSYSRLAGFWLVIAAALLLTQTVFAAARLPRPWVPVRYPELFVQDFNAGFSLAETNNQLSAGPYLLDAGWDGFALERMGDNLTPYLIPGLSESGHTNLAVAGSFRFWPGSMGSPPAGLAL